MKHVTSLLTILRSFGFRCPLKGASGGVKGVSGGIFTSWSDILNAYILSLIWPKIINIILNFNYELFEGGSGGSQGGLRGFQGGFRGWFWMLIKYRYMHVFESHFGHRLSKWGQILGLKGVQGVSRGFWGVSSGWFWMLIKYRNMHMFETHFGHRLSFVCWSPSWFTHDRQHDQHHDRQYDRHHERYLIR